MFTCTSCDNSLPESSFQKLTPKKSGGRPVQYWCRGCMAKQRKKWRQDNPDKYAEARLKVTAHNRHKTHGISAEEYAKMVDSQKGLCLVCGSPPPGKKGLHVSRIFSGLLCTNCHAGTVMFGSLDAFKKAAIHLANNS